MSREQLLKQALILSLITIGYNMVEGVVSVFFGATDDTLALFGFGVDSFVEVISGIGIFHMVMRMSRAQAETLDDFERQALRITGTAFYLLTAGLLVGSVLYVITEAAPQTTVASMIIATLSVLTMYFLMQAKLRVGKQLNSDAIIADAHCTRTCFQLSFILLGSSVLYQWLGIAWLDVIGSLGIAWFAFAEGREAFEKAKTGQLSCSGCGCHCETEKPQVVEVKLQIKPRLQK
jgi:divalent metal cation (Fe/Co/Zn/Cd) transporter